ncbi:MAG: tRNA lysidine(34) synthetase TilS [Planctomycetota bacterium]
MKRSTPDLLETFRCEAAPAAGFDPAAGAVLALSGGPDSTALLDLVLRAGAAPDRVIAAHLDHALRPESSGDARFVADQARTAGVRCRTRRRDVRRIAGPDNLEATARRLRYEFLEAVAVEAGMTVVATGHHLDDQAETVLLRLIRGTGPRGLEAIPPSRALREGGDVRLVRPLLPFRRDQIVAYLAWRGLPYRIDRTNLDGSNARSRLRTEVLPRLARDVPGLALRLAALAERARNLPPAADDAAGGGLRDAVRDLLPADGPAIDRGALERIETILAAGRGAADLGAGWSAAVERGRLVVLPPGGDRPWEPVPLSVPGTADLPDGSLVTAEVCEEGGEVTADRDREIVDGGALAASLVVRPAGPEDTFRPLGAGRETGVLRFLKSQGVPERERRRVPVVWSGARPVWVVGYRIDERVAVGTATGGRVLLRRTSPRPPPGPDPWRPRRRP